MGDDRPVVEFMLMLFLVTFSFMLFPEMLTTSVKNAGYFEGNRTVRDLSFLAKPMGGNVTLYDRSGYTGIISMSSIPSGSPITQAMHQICKEGKPWFNVQVDEETCCVFIRTQSPIPDYIFRLNEIPNKNLSPSEMVLSLDSFYSSKKTFDKKMIETLVYLMMRESLTDKLVLLYEQMMVIINDRNKMFLFDIDFDQLPIFIKTATNLNTIIAAFSISENTLFVYTTLLSREIPYSKVFEARFAKMFPEQKDIKIKNYLSTDDYKGLSLLISDEERSEAMNLLSLYLNDFSKTDKQITEAMKIPGERASFIEVLV
ncbi:hypothetical protein CWI42_121420 [Ordospora colligata]|uniref:Uncharacterized protein n=1 Tax=Ordospora colligata OC4 TaxID=1354746 RepID=A0A0B2UI61_9MICR|nr:uncharacterized protein M896_121420 [Ordospora colligata OC4]KHN68919.1 hypothetical protein M896_121420 [Ordospora colligata OC4]TBU13953.1 hypothetical protein CWI40_121420 [Ordospora colligata]TBU14142.1 hypothetical protein CWI41_121420 [Ordospora colligata]TBU17811.1 hypothetical protein CWI42_121420 [Ordospora colligata]